MKKEKWADMFGICQECGNDTWVKGFKEWSGFPVYLCKKCSQEGRIRYRGPGWKRR